MSVIIQNVSKAPGPGMQDYVLKINSQVIAKFKHIRREGLGECLRKAAHAADMAKVNEELALIQALVAASRSSKSA